MSDISLSTGQNLEFLASLLDPDDAELLILEIIRIRVNNSRESRNNLHRCSIVPHTSSPWAYLYKNGDNTSFNVLMGMSRNSFEELSLIVFDSNINDIKKVGRKPSIGKKGKLALLIFYLNSRCKINELCLIFGLVPIVVSRIIDEILELIIMKLQNHPLSKISFPTTNEMIKYSRLVNLRSPNVSGVIGFVDGITIPIQCSSEMVEQARYYNGHIKDTVINNVLMFTPTGLIVFANLNCPGSWHDANCVIPLVSMFLKSDPQEIFKICVDQGFPRSGIVEGLFVGPLTNKRIATLSDVTRDHLVSLSNDYVSLRQAAEWGMRAVQGTFTRLKSRLTSDKLKRSKIMKAICLLHNFRTNKEGINQIRKVFDPEFRRYINIEGYDRISRYFKSK